MFFFNESYIGNKLKYLECEEQCLKVPTENIILKVVQGNIQKLVKSSLLVEGRSKQR